MILCWVATYTFLPAFLVISERVRPMFHQKEAAWRTRIKGMYGYPFAMLARKFPRALAIVGLSLGVAGIVMSVLYFNDDPMEYDLANIRNERLTPNSAGLLSTRVDKIVGRLGQDGRAILTDRVDQVKPLVAELKRRRDAAPANDQPFSKVVSIFDLLPGDQEKKLVLLREIKERIDRARTRGFITDADWKKLEPHIPKKLEPIGIEDLPEQVARPFTEQDGTRGRIVFIAPTEGKSVYDARYLMAWAESFRHVELPNGEVILGTGDPVIFSDMLSNIAEDAPKATALSLFGTILVIVLAFRGRAAAWLSLGALLIGMSWLIAFLYLMKIKLNFLNFIALPVAIGIGADYAINVMKRREIDGPEQLYRVLVQTGGAVVLCSMTTAGGYIALLLSVNRAVKSFGLAGAVGEIATLLSSMLILPALLYWHARATGLQTAPTSRPRATGATPTPNEPASRTPSTRK
jgi:predicted RND superfamily exporter protein